MKFKLIFSGFLIFTISLIYGQEEPKKKGSDFFKLNDPHIKYMIPDVDVIHEEKTSSQPQNMVQKKYFQMEMKQIIFNPNRSFSIVRTDTTNLFEEDLDLISDMDADESEDLSIVEVNEEINLDSTWVKIADYYSIWDSRSVNPYKIDPSELKDTTTLILYDSTRGRNWSVPLSYCKINDDFGTRKYRWHYGTDLDLSIGDSVFNVFDGIVRICKYDPRGYGNYVLVRHNNGLETVYGHLSRQLVKVGQIVKAGSLVGWGGNTGRSSGPHLHFEMRYQGYAIDPEYFFDFSKKKLRRQIAYITPYNFTYLKQARQKFYHKVRSGDSLYGIASKYRISASKLKRLNGLSNSTMLRVGRKLRLR